MTDPAVLVVGAGPAGLSAARELAVHGVGPVVVVDRESVAGGVPRHCDHTGFGLQDLHRSVTGPAYARHLATRAVNAGADLRLSTTVAEVAPDGSAMLVGPAGIEVVRPTAVLLATGARERPRSARLVPGDRPAGVFTTGQLQQWVLLTDLPVGRRAVVVGAEHVAYSAVLTLRHAGVATVAMVTELPRHQTVPAFAWMTRLGLRVPLLARSRVSALHGHGRLKAVDVTDLVTGTVDRVEADTVVFTGDWVPDNELARRMEVGIERATRGPRTDGWGRTTRAGVLAAGNLVHPGETAGIAAVAGRTAARRLVDDLGRGTRPIAAGLGLTTEWPLVSVVPAVGDPSDLPSRFLVRTGAFTDRRLVVARQGGGEIGRHRLRHSVPNRSLSVPGSLLGAADADGGPVELTLN
ncbi:MAG TPA: FAD-dependent oxidoreductase [Acidimicrobiales bacterium]